MGAPHPVVPPALLAKLRAVCLGLPEVEEQAAWTGIRWCIRGRNFAHVLKIEAGWPPAYAEAARCQGPACVLTFRLPPAQLDAARFSRAPFFRPVWWPDIGGVMLGDDTEWDEVESLLAASYCRLAPRRLAARVTPQG
jgi:hypothetical protein